MLPRILLALAASAASLLAEPAALSPADADWTRVLDARNPLRLYSSKEEFDRRTTVEALPAQERVQQDVFVAAREFFLKHPDEPRRLEALALFLDLSALANFYVRTPTKDEMPSSDRKMTAREWNRWYATTPAITIDRVAREQWLRQGEEMVAMVLDSPHVPAVKKEEAAFGRLHRDLFQLRRQTLEETLPDWRGAWKTLRERFARHATEYVELPESAPRVAFFMRQFEGCISYYQRYQVIPRETGKAVIKEDWEYFLSSSDPRVQDVARAGLADLTHREQATLDEINFIALDGRKVDVRDKRGNVVLVDFWALWCKPCVDEMPILRRIYKEYRGFTIVGINCDSENDKAKLKQFLEDGGYDWPQHFDGKGPANEFARLYQVTAWPTTYLIGKDGKVVAKNIRGDGLEPAIRKALGLEP